MKINVLYLLTSRLKDLLDLLRLAFISPKKYFLSVIFNICIDYCDGWRDLKAVIVVDMLKDFIYPEGALPISETSKLIENLENLVKTARRREVPVIFVCDSHRVGDREFEDWPPHAIIGTKGAEVIDELKPEPKDFIVYKRRFSGFYMTDLELLLCELEVKELFVTGVLTDICVLATALDSKIRGFKTYVVEDCCKSVSIERHENALRIMNESFKINVLKCEEAIKKISEA